MRLVGRGSAKDLYESPDAPGRVLFEFTDRVSVFDYGALPDAVPGKGKALESSAFTFFRKLAARGLATAFDAETSSRLGRCALERVKHPKFPGAETAALEFIPLEVIFRWGAPSGSSFLRRRPDVKAGQRFDQVVVEFSTKLEASDRMVDEAEAATLAGSAQILTSLRQYAIDCATALRDELKGCGLELWDGKIECAWDPRAKRIVMVDAITLDELRVSLPGLEKIPLSKELLRQWLGATPWAFEIKRAKETKGADWKRGLSAPPRLGPWRLEKLSRLYQAFSECLESSSPKPLLAWAREDALKPRVFVSGAGGREAALKWRLELEGCEIAGTPESADVAWASPDADLADGLVDHWLTQGLWTYGPIRSAARLESSKRFGREVATEAGVPSPLTKLEGLREFPRPPVVKFDGLAAGKGVIVPETWDEAEAAYTKLRAQGAVLLEERLEGFEASAFFNVENGASGPKVRFLGAARDFKRRFAGDEGPNTGGMGAYAPHPEVAPGDIEHFTNWARATVAALGAKGIPYQGILYLGLMKDRKSGWKLIEYNARFGDPETQALVMAWPAEARVLRSMLQLDLKVDERPVELARTAVCLALVRTEYPDPAPEIALPPWSAPVSSELQLFRAQSTKGRVAYLVGAGEDVFSAADQVFQAWVESPWKDLLDWRMDILP